MAALQQELAGSSISATTVLPGYIRDTGLYHVTGMRVPKLLGQSTAAQVSQGVQTALRKKPEELFVNPGPTRLTMALQQLFPQLGDWVLRMLRITQENQVYAGRRSRS